MTFNPLAAGDDLHRRVAWGASLGRGRSCLINGLLLAGPRWFANAKASSGGATAGRNENIAQIHL
ncbi:MAG: hypothetical protein ACREDV_08665 [Methylocella sp.]